MPVLIDIGEAPGGHERNAFGYGWQPNKRWEVTITYPSGAQQFYGVGSSAMGTIQFSYPLYEEGEVHFQVTEPGSPFQADAGDPSIKAHEQPTNRRAPSHISGGDVEVQHVRDLPDHLKEAVGAKRLESANKAAERMAAVLLSTTDPLEKQTLLTRFHQAASQVRNLGGKGAVVEALEYAERVEADRKAKLDQELAKELAEEENGGG